MKFAIPRSFSLPAVNPSKFREKALAAGAVAFFRKPIDQEEMLSIIRHTVGTHRTPQSAPLSGF